MCQWMVATIKFLTLYNWEGEAFVQHIVTGAESWMWNEKHDQWIIVNFFIKLKKTLTEDYKMLKETCGENSLSRACVFEWYK